MLNALRLPLVLILPIILTVPAFSQSPAAKRLAALGQLSGAAAPTLYAGRWRPLTRWCGVRGRACYWKRGRSGLPWSCV